MCLKLYRIDPWFTICYLYDCSRFTETAFNFKDNLAFTVPRP